MMLYKRMALGTGLLAVGYLLGSLGLFSAVRAQEGDAGPTDDSVKKIVAANDALKAAVDQLKLESRYEVATKGINSYAVMVGGLNAKEDLESGRGVDPETFAALYAATYDLKKLSIKDETLADWVDVSLLDYDAEGRLTYQNKVVRIYPVSRLKKLNTQRRVLIGEAKAEKKK
ncbi:MAG: hypothetical protein AABP62_02400 [Planctomycetota bacterium]